MATDTELLERLRALCLALPEAHEDEKWGSPHFCVRGKIFTSFYAQDGRRTIGFKLDKAHAFALVDEPGFRPSKYVGKHGWVSMDLGDEVDWDEVREYLLESYRLIAPKRLSSKLDAAEGSGTR